MGIEKVLNHKKSHSKLKRLLSLGVNLSIHGYFFISISLTLHDFLFIYHSLFVSFIPFLV